MPSDPLGTGTPTTDTPTATNSLQVNQQLGLDQYRTSTSGKFWVYLQGDGNLVLKNLSTAALIWSSNTPNKGGQRLVMQGDGNLVLYSTSGAPLWATGTTGGSYLMVQGDGNLVLFSASGTALWASNTSGLSFAQE